MMPTIKKGLVTFSFQDGDCDNVKITKQGSLDENPMPASDSDSAFVLDFNGVLKTITLKGNITTATTTRTSTGTTTTIEAQIDWLIALVDGSQDGYTFNSTFQTNKTVYCRKVDFDENAGEPNKVPYTIEFVEGL
jgi:hypothetical protein